MAGQIEYADLELGYQFPPSNFTLDESQVEKYIIATGDTNSLFNGTRLVPPMAVAAQAMRALAEGISLPAGAIHVSQELEFINTVKIGETLTSRSAVNRNQNRGKLHMLTIEINVSKPDNEPVLSGKTSFILPQLPQEET